MNTNYCLKNKQCNFFTKMYIKMSINLFVAVFQYINFCYISDIFQIRNHILLIDKYISNELYDTTEAFFLI